MAAVAINITVTSGQGKVVSVSVGRLCPTRRRNLMAALTIGGETGLHMIGVTS